MVGIGENGLGGVGGPEDEDAEAAVIADDFREVHVSGRK